MNELEFCLPVNRNSNLIYGAIFFFFSLNYLQYELLFCIENKSDPAIKVVEQLMKEYPTIDARLFIGM